MICTICDSKMKWDEFEKEFVCIKCGPKVLGVDKSTYSTEEMFEKTNRPLSEKLKETKKIIKKHKKHSSISWSGGKDSTLLTHIAKQVCPKMPVIYVDTGVDFPESSEYVKIMIEKYKWKNVHILKPEVGFWKIKIKLVMGIHLLYLRKGMRRCMNVLKADCIDKFSKEHNITKHLIGNRWDEGERWALFYIFGEEDFRFNQHRIFPVAWWDTKQVYEYFSKYEIPLNPLYTMGYDRQGCYICPACPEDKLKKIHPELFKLRKKAKRLQPTLYMPPEKLMGKWRGGE